jgi:hypothetical protein
MPCSSRHPALLPVGFACLLAVSAAVPARSQQEPDRAAAQQQPSDNSIDRWNRMSPEERERELAKLPPARARMIRQRIRRYNQMNPDEQQVLRERYQTFSQLPPDKRQIVRQRMHEFQQLPGPRQQIVHTEVEQFRLLSEPQRQARMSSEEFRGQFSAREQQIIRDLSTYLPK